MRATAHIDHLPRRRRAHHPWIGILACGLLLMTTALQVRAQDTDSEAQALPEDTVMVITRTVNPRTAYRGVPLEANPVRTQATTFPGRIFNNTLNNTLGQLLGDDDLDQRGSAGLNTGAGAVPALTGASSMLAASPALGGQAASGGTSIGPSASVGGAIGAATGGISNMVTGSVMQAVGAATAAGSGP